MPLVSMLIRSIISYSIFLLSKKIVKSSIGISGTLKKTLKLHRCTNCWRLYSGDIEECTFCNHEVTPLYQIYENFGNEEESDHREGIDKYVYKGFQQRRYKPLNLRGRKYDRNTTRTN